MRIKEGSKVCFSAAFCRNTGQQTGELPFARGVVTGIRQISDGFFIATVQWDTEDMPQKVNTQNLSVINSNGIQEPR